MKKWIIRCIPGFIGIGLWMLLILYFKATNAPNSYYTFIIIIPTISIILIVHNFTHDSKDSK
jgi:uncharacterized membrane protein